MPGYNSDATVNTLAEQIANGGSDLRATVWSRIIEQISQTEDDFTALEGPVGSDKPIWRKNELKADGGDTVVMTTFGGVSGPGVTGEQELTGNTSDFEMGTYKCRVDFWRDAVEITKKLQKFLANGQLLESTIWKALSEKLARNKQYKMMFTFIREANGNVLRPNGRLTRDTLTITDTLTTSLFNQSKAFLTGIGGREVDMTRSASGSKVLKYMVFTGQDAMASVRDSSSWQNALKDAGERSNTANPLFSGKLVDWNGMYVFEHSIVTTPNIDDWLGSPIQPIGKLGTAITAGTTVIDITFGSANLKKLYAAFFPGYDWKMFEEQVAAPDTNDYYLWIVNPANAVTDPGKAGFYKYTGTGNNGNKITIKDENGDSNGAGGRLGSATSGKRSTKVGGITWNSAYMTDVHPVGAKIIPANSIGTPIGHTFVFGAGAGVRCYGSINAQMIEQKRDFDFVKGMGYMSIFGQTTAKDTDGIPRHYALVQHAVSYPGITVPYLGYTG